MANDDDVCEKRILSKKWYTPGAESNVVYWSKTWNTWVPSSSKKKKKLTRFKKIFAYLVIENISIICPTAAKAGGGSGGYQAAVTLKYGATKFECDPYNGLCSMARRRHAAPPIRHSHDTMALSLNQKVHLPDEAGHRATARIRFDDSSITTTIYIHCTPVAAAAAANRKRSSKKQQLAILSEDFDKGLLKAFCVHGMFSKKKSYNK